MVAFVCAALADICIFLSYLDGHFVFTYASIREREALTCTLSKVIPVQGAWPWQTKLADGDLQLVPCTFRNTRSDTLTKYLGSFACCAVGEVMIFWRFDSLNLTFDIYFA